MIKSIGVIICFAIFVLLYPPVHMQPGFAQPFNKMSLGNKVQLYRSLLKENRDNHSDVAEAIRLNQKAKQAAARHQPEMAHNYLDQAIALLSGKENHAFQERAVTIDRENDRVKPGEAPFDTPLINLKMDQITDLTSTGYLHVTKSVPGADQGSDVKAYASAFETTRQRLKKGRAALTLSAIPIYVETGMARSVKPTKDSTSPFGMHPPHTTRIPRRKWKTLLAPSRAHYEYDNALDLGIAWGRPGYSCLWDRIQQTDSDLKQGRFNWKESDYVLGSMPETINILGNIRGITRSRTKKGTGRFHITYTFKTRKLEEQYRRFVTRVVERYDGDGMYDMPGLKNPVQYWQIGNEPSHRSRDWQGYLRLFEISSEAVKAACPGCKVVMGGNSRGLTGFRAFYIPLLEKMKDYPIDVFDIHHFGLGNRNCGKEISKLKHAVESALIENGHLGTEIWMTEFGTYAGQPWKPGPRRGRLPKQTQALQAEQLVKGMVVALAKGIKKVFWAWGMVDGFGLDGGIFDHTGLITETGDKKLAFYAYKLLIEKLRGCDFSLTRELDLGKGIHAYEFFRPGSSIVILWSEYRSYDRY